MEKKALGKGLSAILDENISDKKEENWITNLPIDKIVKSELQPRKEFEEEDLEELSKSIKENGILQPLLVRHKDKFFELIAGERRFRAAQKIGLRWIPAIVIEASDNEVLQLSLIENLQRADLTPVEVALAYKKLQSDFNLSQQEIADRVSKERSTIANYLRLLTLPQFIIEKLNNKEISLGHAKAILSLDDSKKRIELCKEIVSNSLSVRDIEKMVNKILRGEKPKHKARGKEPDVIELENNLSKKFGTKVQINKGKTKGNIRIEFYSHKDLERILAFFI